MLLFFVLNLFVLYAIIYLEVKRMKKMTGSLFMKQMISDSVLAFLNMPTEDRKKMIRGFYTLLPYQQTAIIQCKKNMTYDERKTLKEVVE